jgi:site-specific recombinase XerC
MLLTDAISAYVADRAARGEVAAYTAAQLAWRLGLLAQLHPGLEVGELTGEHVADWQRATGAARASSRRAYLSTLRGFCAWAAAEGLLGADPTVRAGRVHEPHPQPRALSASRYARLILVLPDDRARLIVGLMRNSGLRCAEVAAIRPGDYDPAAGELRVHGKGGAVRDVAVCDDEADLLAARAGRDPVIGVTAGRISRLVSTWMGQAGLKTERYDGVSAHALRHTAASELLEVCANVRLVQEFLGHANLATTDRYLRKTPLAALKAAQRAAAYKRTG